MVKGWEFRPVIFFLVEAGKHLVSVHYTPRIRIHVFPFWQIPLMSVSPDFEEMKTNAKLQCSGAIKAIELSFNLPKNSDMANVPCQILFCFIGAQ